MGYRIGASRCIGYDLPTAEEFTERIRAYGRPLGENDALEILENLGRLAEALLEAKRRIRK